ncbi:MAG TPA: class I SAM-dependent methyltransferase [Herpetosiphonaceae bacterium]|nr:class I SAM-dependent methyltransferase [Herpetosiphonaceae bacterium]
MSNEHLNDAGLAIWDANAEFWDAALGQEGNRFHRMIVEPAVLGLLAPRPGERIVELGCGNGAFARRLAGLGADVLATDFSAGLLERARARGCPGPGSVAYARADATSLEQVLALGERSFDAAACLMALMDMPEIEPAFAGLSRLLKPGGRCVFALQHPCFNSNGAAKTVAHEDRDGELIERYSMNVWRYHTPWAERAIGIRGQEQAHYIFHRPLHVLLGAAFAAGFVLDGLAEPADPADPQPQRWQAWSNFKETPPVLAARLLLR